MGPFLHGFADELIKIAGSDAWPGMPVRKPTVTGYEKAPTPSGAVPPNPQVLGSMGNQRMEWSPTAKKDTWRPSPGFRMPKPEPKPAPKPGGVSRPKPKNVEPSFESVQDKAQRLRSERSFNAGRAAASSPDPFKNAPPEAKGTTAKSLPADVVKQSPERTAFTNALPKNPASSSLRAPGGLRPGAKDLPKGGYGKVDPSFGKPKIDSLEALHPGAPKIDVKTNEDLEGGPSTAKVEPPPPAPRRRQRPAGQR